MANHKSQITNHKITRSQVVVASVNWKRHLNARAAFRRGAYGDAAVVCHDDLLDDGQAQARPVRFGREKRAEYAIAGGRRDPRSVVVDRDAHQTLDLIDIANHGYAGRHPGTFTGL